MTIAGVRDTSVVYLREHESMRASRMTTLLSRSELLEVAIGPPPEAPDGVLGRGAPRVRPAEFFGCGHAYPALS